MKSIPSSETLKAPSPTLDTPAVRLDVVRGRAGLGALERHWNALLQTSAVSNVFLTWEWMTTWCDSLGGSDSFRILVARDDATDEPVGIAPFVVQPRPRTGPPAWRELVFMGSTTAAPDHLDCIARSGWELSVSRAVADWLRVRSGRESWDVLRLDGMRPESELVRRLLNGGVPRERVVWEVHCPFVTLPDRWDTFERSLDGKFRRDLRRRMRKLVDEAGAPVRFITALPGDLGEAVSGLFRLHQALRGRNGGHGAFDGEAKRRFYRQIAHRFAERGWLRLHLLEVGGRSIAAALCFRFGGRVYFYQTGYDPLWSRYAPGRLVIRDAIRSAIEEGAQEFDMLRGNHPYKYDWNAESRSILKLRVASTPRGGVVVPALKVLRAGRERWKAWRRMH